MNKEEMYKQGNKVLTDAEYGKFLGAFEEAEEKCMDIISDMRDAITGLMNILLERNNATEFVGERFTIINRSGDISFIDRDEDDTEEWSLEEIVSESLAMDILAEMI